MMAVELVDSGGIARLVGRKDSKFALTKMRTDPSFPKPVQGGTGLGRYQWALADITLWKQSYKCGSHAGPEPRRTGLCNAMAQQVVRLGWKRGGRAVAATEVRHGDR